MAGIRCSPPQQRRLWGQAWLHFPQSMHFPQDALPMVDAFLTTDLFPMAAVFSRSPGSSEGSAGGRGGDPEAWYLERGLAHR